MKGLKKILLVSTLIIAAGGYFFAQNSRRPDALEQEIRKLDSAQADAIRRRDFEALDRLCAEDLTVNSPRNDLVKGLDALKDLIRLGTIDYASFTREIETVSIYEKTAVVMGRETVVTNETAAAQAGQILRRRFTNVWVKRGGRWLLTARHASIIPPAN
jgi:ketosteroid isomerase-like protein